MVRDQDGGRDQTGSDDNGYWNAHEAEYARFGQGRKSH
jgi:hypothetical protein